MAKREVPEVNAGSMADIAFLLLIFFLVTTTMQVDTGLRRKLPPMEDPNDRPPKIKERNLFEVHVNSEDMLLARKKEIDIRSLKAAAKEFIMNERRAQDMPEHSMTNIEHIGEYPVSKCVISLQNDRGTTYSRYIEVQNELVAAYSELRDELSKSKFGMSYAKLQEEDEVKAKAIDQAIPQKISEAEPKTYK